MFSTPKKIQYQTKTRKCNFIYAIQQINRGDWICFKECEMGGLIIFTRITILSISQFVFNRRRKQKYLLEAFLAFFLLLFICFFY